MRPSIHDSIPEAKSAKAKSASCEADPQSWRDDGFARREEGLHGVRRVLQWRDEALHKTTIPVRKDVQRVGKMCRTAEPFDREMDEETPRKVCPESRDEGRQPDLWLGFPFGSRSSRSGRAGREELFVLGETHVVDEVGVCSIGQRADFFEPATNVMTEKL